MNKLINTKIEDNEKIKQYIALKERVKKLEMELQFAEDVLDDNEHLEQYTWTTKEGGIYSIYELQDQHLKNIFRVTDGRLSAPLLKEYYRRFGNNNLLEF